MKRKMMIAGSVLTLCTLGTLTAVYAATSPASTSSPSSSTASSQTAHKNTFFYNKGNGNGTAQGLQKSGFALGVNGQKVFVSNVDELTNVLGIDSATLKKDLQNGQTLAQIAQGQGISESTLNSDLESNLKSQLDQAVSNGKLTSDMENEMLTKMDAHMKQMVENKGIQKQIIAKSGDGSQTKKGPGMVLGINGQAFSISDAIASALGIDSATLKTDLQNGESLAQIAQSKGISEDTLISNLESNLKFKFDQAVSSGKITSTMENKLLSGIDAHAKQMVESAGGAWSHVSIIQQNVQGQGF
jgi:lambda repressor-like predicted transcriptional regulator